jgi:nuclear cap-binding protein subunit 1
VKDLPSPQSARPKYKLEDLLVDGIFAQLFRLPWPREREVCYTALLTEVTKLAPQDVAPTLGRAIRWIYDRIDGIVGEVSMRFSTWFAAHLSNFGFTYKWEEWFLPFPSPSLSNIPSFALFRKDFSVKNDWMGLIIGLGI